MNINTLQHPVLAASFAHCRSPSLKRSHSEMRTSISFPTHINEEHYHDYVLRLSSDITEYEIDRKLRREADEMGLTSLHLSTNVQSITSSLSATTIASDPTINSSILTQSTAPTSCSSSDRPPTSSSHKSQEPSPSPIVPFKTLEAEKKRRDSSFRRGIRKMTGFTLKRKAIVDDGLSTQLGSQSGSRSDISSANVAEDANADTDVDKTRMADLIVSDPGTHTITLTSFNTGWSQQQSTVTKADYDTHAQTVLIDHQALKRSLECPEMVGLRERQLREKQRFVEYQKQLISQIRSEREALKTQKREMHDRILSERIEKNARSIEGLEVRQLEEELKMLQEHEHQKRVTSFRLKHMEAYCQTPSPPPTPSDAGFSPANSLPNVSHAGSDRASSSAASVARGSIDSNIGSINYIPERRITDKDYHSLASQYRERDAMDNLHASKINVLRGRQKRAIESLTLKKEREIEALECEQQKQIDAIDSEYAQQEGYCRAEFDERGRVLERRWRLAAMIERAKAEGRTNEKFELLPDVTTTEESNISSMPPNYPFQL